ncbi:MAG: cyclic nucleotide-binding protein [Flavobacteriales bacterium]|nr:Crp/Fnr family transcriptional regulator [Bacteroidales bacterium AH-315-I05]PCJ90054.1 MAG: cyclic nucleotide-binding protein [Flavobacteriales bacterium]
MEIETLIMHFKAYLSLNEEEIQELSSRVSIRTIKRRQFLLSEGEKCKHYNFVVSGCFKMYKIDPAGKEHNLLFACENEWVTDIGSFHTEKPSELYIEAIEPSTVIQIKKEDLLFFYMNYPKFDRNFRVIIEDKFVELQNRLLQTFSSTAEERYLSFLDQYPHLLQRLPNTQIASYIGITPEFLSRIRKELSRK